MCIQTRGYDPAWGHTLFVYIHQINFQFFTKVCVKSEEILLHINNLSGKLYVSIFKKIFFGDMRVTGIQF